jgi:hypothetical protein
MKVGESWLSPLLLSRSRDECQMGRKKRKGDALESCISLNFLNNNALRQTIEMQREGNV